MEAGSPLLEILTDLKRVEEVFHGVDLFYASVGLMFGIYSFDKGSARFGRPPV